METKSIKIHQENMYCTKCLNNVVKAISKIADLKYLDINMSNKTIRIKYQNCELSKDEIRNLINVAITTGKIN